jgi:CubicO group peptidase (beta-lactamase class C family)
MAFGLRLALVAALLRPAALPERVAAAAAEPDFAAIDRYVEREMEDMRLPGLALGIVRGAQIVYLKGYGAADPSGRPVTPRTPFHLASLGKSFTALAVMQLVEAGRVELDAPVRRYLPWFRMADERASAQMTVRHLLTQTSGISSAASGAITQRQHRGPDAMEQSVRALATVELQRPVGAAFEYANVNYVVLGLIVQEVSGQPYAEYVRQRIFAPLAMRDAYLDPAEDEARGAAIGHAYWFDIPLPAPLPAFPGDQPAGADSFSASAEDLAHYLIAQLGGGRYGERRILSADGIATLHRPAAPTGAPETFYGMGWQQEAVNGVRVTRHSGALFSFNADMLLAPGAGWGVVVLVNGQSFLRLAAGDDHMQAIGPGVIGLLHGGQPPAPAAGGVWRVYLVLLLVIAIQLGGMGRTLGLPRRWRARPERRPTGWRAGLGQIGLSLALNLGWGIAILAGLPAASGYSLRFLGMMYPDVIASLTASALTALGWAVLRTALVGVTLRGTPAPTTAWAPPAPRPADGPAPVGEAAAPQ